MLLLRGGFVMSLGKGKPHDQNILGIEAELDVLQREKAAHQQARAHQ